MNISTIGLDLAKQVFQVHGVDARGKVVLQKRLKRAEMAEFFANLPPCLIGMEACGTAHYWGRKLESFGHTVKLMAPRFVKPYLTGEKNDANDAAAIYEAVTRPSMRFVPLKSAEQQALLVLHRTRAGLVHSRTAASNQVRGLLLEFGIALKLGRREVMAKLPGILEDAENGLPPVAREGLGIVYQHLKDLEQCIVQCEHAIIAWHRQSEASQRLAAIPGIGVFSATALVASVGDAEVFKNGRQFAAWLGLVPRQHSSGGREHLSGISKRGDRYLRTLLILGAQSKLRHRSPEEVPWIDRLLERRHKNVAAVALANKNARCVWALLAQKRTYQPGYVSTRPTHGARAVTSV
ncbi:MAG: IS110 family transposase [Gammaproteobacteria bacterium]